MVKVIGTQGFTGDTQCFTVKNGFTVKKISTHCFTGFQGKRVTLFFYCVTLCKHCVTL